MSGLMQSLPQGYRAAVIGASGAIGGAVAAALAADPRCAEVLRLSRSGAGPSGAGDARLDLSDEDSIAAAAAAAGERHLVFIATGALTVANPGGAPFGPEKALSHLSAEALMAAYALNAVGPALVIKHFTKALPRTERSLVAALSARVGSIGDNGLGGWYGYRAAKAGLNQLIRTAAIEIARKRPAAAIAALHPGTVESGLSRPFRPAGAEAAGVFTPEQSAERLLGVLDSLSADQTGGFWDYAGRPIPW